MRIAIVGAGVSGLVVAHLLASRHEVTVFEADTLRRRPHEHDPGRHAERDARDRHRVHRVQRPQLPELRATADEARRRLAAVDDELQRQRRRSATSSTRGARRTRCSPTAAILLTPWFHRMVTDLARFNRAARELLALEQAGRGPSLGDWLERQRFSRAFIDRLIVPQASAVWSADPDQMWSFPARFLAEFFDHHGMLGFRGRPQWRTVRGGSRRYVEALLARFGGRSGWARRCARITRGRRPRARAPGRGRGRAVRRGRARDAFRPGARAARGREHARARDPRRDPLPAQRGRAPHRRAHAPARRRARGRAGTTTCSPSRRIARPSRTT